MTSVNIGGVLPVLYSFFDHKGSLRLDGFKQQSDHCLENGARGVVLFGYVTQFYRLTFQEKLLAIRETVKALGSRGSLAVTVMEASPEAQKELIKVAREEGANWVILQPPIGPACDPCDWIEMLKPLIQTAGLPVTIQNALIAGTHLSNSDLVDLQEDCPNLIGVKAETQSEDIAAFCANFSDRFRILIGNWGVEYPFFLRHGAHGLIPAPNFVAEQVALHEAAEREDWDLVDHIQKLLLPLMQFIRERPAPEGQLLLGKQAYAWRTGFDAGYNRAPGPAACDPLIIQHAKRLWDAMDLER